MKCLKKPATTFSGTTQSIKGTYLSIEGGYCDQAVLDVSHPGKLCKSKSETLKIVNKVMVFSIVFAKFFD